MAVPDKKIITVGLGDGGGSVELTSTLIKKKIKFSSYIRKFRVEQLQSHIRGRAS
jgi:hypothetical protein